MASHLPTQPFDPTTTSHLPHRTSALAGRRPPAHKSVSLRHSSLQLTKPSILSEPNRQAPTISSSNDAQPSSRSPSERPKHNQHSSGESSDAGNWFTNSNNNIRRQDAYSPDNDPPFFLRNPSSSSTPPDQTTVNPYQNASYPTHAQNSTLPHMANDGSSGDDYRSVIDDLTIANKKLKRKLRRYERMHDAHLQGEKLFEIRFHGLPDHKKRELEEKLRNFAMGIDDPPRGPRERPAGNGSTLSEQQNHKSTPHPLKTKPSSHTSRFAESGYASMSISGQEHSITPSGMEGTPKSNIRPSFSMQNSEIRSYLHDIPAGLRPNESSRAMSEKARQKLVVRRLEQIFAGKGAVLERHQQPIQQQEVSRSAARADRKEMEASGQSWKREGVRVAKIMPHATGNDAEMEQSLEPIHNTRSVSRIAEQEAAGDHSPDQRPTRPLDLDLYREQVPADNIEYIRHLGFTPPDMEHSPEQGHGWVYLNLLINMAQLHTVNVTLEFVQKAINNRSSHLELSHDGRKIRWRGGSKLTRHNSDSSSGQDDQDSPDSTFDETTGEKVKKPKRVSDPSNALKRYLQMAQFDQVKASNKHVYTPLFTHKTSSNDDDCLTPSNPSTLSPPIPGHESSAFASSGLQSNLPKRRRDDGPMIFYNKAKFCTDLTGDLNHAKTSATYETMTQKAIGDTVEHHSMSSSPSERRDPAGYFNHAEDVDMRDPTSNESTPSDLNFSLKSLEDYFDAHNDPHTQQTFEASGLGGVQPEDNFAINVVSRQSRGPAYARPHDGAHLPPKLRAILSGNHHSHPNTAMVDQIMSTTTHSLPSSALPPASYLTLQSSSGDADSDGESGTESDFSMSSTQHQPIAQRQPVANMPFDYIMSEESSEEDMDDDEDEDEDDDEELVDFLAIARQFDPEAIRVREREYESNAAERLAEEIPAGSSAATRGGGSGFNSPDDVDPSKVAHK